ncbi:MAG: hypothetical protein HUJ27_12395 [Rhodobacteraceae bacterium]|nr:hypothetical protein [Paracoccaceae bacterium]
MSESQVVSAKSAGDLIAEVKLKLADGWKVKGISAHDPDADIYTQEMVK